MSRNFGIAYSLSQEIKILFGSDQIDPDYITEQRDKARERLISVTERALEARLVAERAASKMALQESQDMNFYAGCLELWKGHYERRISKLTAALMDLSSD